jgi:dihydroneopterin aldolase
VPRPRDVLSIHGLCLECVVGIHPHERDQPQPLRIDVDLRLDTESAARSERIGSTVDYDAMAAQIAFLLQAGRFELLETAAHVLAVQMLAPPAVGERRTQIHSVRLRLTKPSAMAGRAIPALEIERDARWARLEAKATPFGSIEVLHQSRHTRIYRMNLDPGRSVTRRSARRTTEAELVLGDGMERDGEPVPAGTAIRDPAAPSRAYRNPAPRSQSLLCVDRKLAAERGAAAPPSGLGVASSG